MEFASEFEYPNPNGNFVLTKDGKQKKTFRQRRPDPERPGLWIWNVDGVPILPYRLPELIEAMANKRMITIVEGEAKVDLLWRERPGDLLRRRGEEMARRAQGTPTRRRRGGYAGQR